MIFFFFCRHLQRTATCSDYGNSMVLIYSVPQSDPNSVCADSFLARSDATRSNLSMRAIYKRARRFEKNRTEASFEFAVLGGYTNSEEFTKTRSFEIDSSPRHDSRSNRQMSFPLGITGIDSQARRILPACFVGIYERLKSRRNRP